MLSLQTKGGASKKDTYGRQIATRDNAHLLLRFWVCGHAVMRIRVGTDGNRSAASESPRIRVSSLIDRRMYRDLQISVRGLPKQATANEKKNVRCQQNCPPKTR